MANFVLKTERLFLEPAKVSDAEAIWPYVSDPRIPELMSWEPHKSIDETIGFLKDVEARHEQGKAYSWTIRFNNQIVGIFSVISILRSHRHLTFDKAELAYWLAPEYQGKGLMVEAGEKILDFSFNELKLHKIYVGHHAGNLGSQNLIQRLKFRFSHIEKQAFKKHGQWIDVSYYEMLETEHKNLFNIKK